MNISSNLLWQPLLEASAQTIVGAIGGYAVGAVLQKLSKGNTYEGRWTFGEEESEMAK